jgi:carboxyl-terminal processing protease
VSENLRKKVIAVVVAFCLVLPQMVFAQDAAGTGDAAKDLDYLKSVMDMIKEKYKGDVTDSQLIEGALKGMFGTLDPYTTYWTPEEADQFLGEMSGNYEGIGVSIYKEDDYIVVGKVFEGSPAEKSKIYVGDKIVEAGGKSLVGASPDDATRLIKGEPGTSVTLGIVRSGTEGTIKIDVERAQVTINPITYKIKDGIGYIKIEIFNSNTYGFLLKALSEMDGNGVKKLILDLRDNPGGEAEMAVMAARKFVPKGLITKLDFKDEDQQDVEYYSSLESPKYKLAVLVNKMSASASEILAGAIQDTKAGVLIGTKTFGKAKVQSVFPILTPEAYKKYEAQLGRKIADGEDLEKLGITPQDSDIMGWTKITTGTYTTPSGRMIDGTGLTPDIEVDDSAEVNGVDVTAVQRLSGKEKLSLNGEGMDVYYAEEILKADGYEVDAPDAKLDAKTFNALAKFQRDNGLFPCGVLDFATQHALNDRLEKLVMENDAPYAKAVEILNQ